MSMHRLSGCPSCAEPLEEGDRFCGVCGYALSAPPPPPPPDHAPTLPDPARVVGAGAGHPAAAGVRAAGHGYPGGAAGHDAGAAAGAAGALPGPAPYEAGAGSFGPGPVDDSDPTPGFGSPAGSPYAVPAPAGGGYGVPARQGGQGFGSAVGVPAPGWEGTPVPPGSASTPWTGTGPEAPDGHPGATGARYGTAPQANPHEAPYDAPAQGDPHEGPYGTPGEDRPETRYGTTPQARPHEAPYGTPPQGDPYDAPGGEPDQAPDGAAARPEARADPYGGVPEGDPHTARPGSAPQGDPYGGAPLGDPPGGGGRTCVACRAGAVDTDGYCEHCGHAQPRERDHLEEELCSVAAVSDRGLRHHRNEDSFAVAATALPDGSAATVAIVCDGVSSASRPDDASAAAAGAASEALLDALPRGAHPAEAMHEAILAAGAAVSALAPQPPGAQNAPACTLVGAVVSGGVLTVGWVGDSRAYWVPDDRATLPRRLTEDDSWAAQMVAAGLMGEAEAYADARAHAITGWLGADAYDLDPHTASFRPDHPGVVVVCTDGLWNYAESATDMARILPADAAERPLHCAQVLVGHALDGGGHDNITVAVVPFTAAPPQPGAETAAEPEPQAGAGAEREAAAEPPHPPA
ncbi:protein phosphatase 2C domain-containing protein [Streptomyces racemochromogenes]|uniref:Protein phosphatase 2C domain-containing protein n=1 Tax=Streptomyces racemochromogenes TaxID=67353 RepID=A0ABW7PG00_9ACTN